MIGDGRETYAYSTLKSMRKEELISVIRCLESNIIGQREMNDNQFKLLVENDLKNEKYRWHDLRKNPDDLPEEDSKIVVFYGTLYEKSYYNIEPAKMFRLPLTVIHDDDNGHDILSPVAWKYIELFDEEEE